MNYTENYHLPQWEETDRIMRTDFNAAMANLEAGITEAKTTADTLPYVVGTYPGTGTAQTIDVGFTPLFVITTTPSAGGSAESALGRTSVIVKSQYIWKGNIVANGFHLEADDTNSYYPRINLKGYTYTYIAFR